MKQLDVLATVLVIVGALNWGLVAIAQFDLVAALFGMSFGETSPLTASTGVLAWALAAHASPRTAHAQLECDTIVPASLDHTFAFFSNASNLERLTPSWLNFTILTPMPVVMREGAEIDYRIRLYGLSIPWRTRIDVWEPGARFIDRQIVGPYRWWHHEHIFEAVAGGTRVIDRLEYVPRAQWISGWLVRRDVERIFTYRQLALREIFSATAPAGGG